MDSTPQSTASPVDHLVYATKDLEAGIANLELLLGVTPRMGGSHPGLGTRNALIGLGNQCYLEIIGPDPGQTNFRGTRPFGIDDIKQDLLVTWAARRSNLRAWSQQIRAQDIELSDAIEMSRETPAGETLSWELSFLADAMTVAPFFIDWASSPHPATQCPQGPLLNQLLLEHPDPERIETLVDLLELDVCVEKGPRAGIRALINCHNGEVELRSHID